MAQRLQVSSIIELKTGNAMDQVDKRKTTENDLLYQFLIMHHSQTFI